MAAWDDIPPPALASNGVQPYMKPKEFQVHHDALGDMLRDLDNDVVDGILSPNSQHFHDHFYSRFSWLAGTCLANRVRYTRVDNTHLIRR